MHIFCLVDGFIYEKIIGVHDFLNWENFLNGQEIRWRSNIVRPLVIRPNNAIYRILARFSLGYIKNKYSIFE